MKKPVNVFTISLISFILITSAALNSIRTFPTPGVMGWQEERDPPLPKIPPRYLKI